MDSSVQPLDLDNGTDPFEQPAELIRQGLDGLRLLCDQQRSEIERLRQEANRVQAEVGQLRIELAAAKEEKEQSTQEVATLQQRLAEASSEVQTLKRENEQLRKDRAETEARLSALQTELDAARQQLAAREQELETKRKEISGINKSLNRSKKTLNCKREDLDAERATNQELRQARDAATQNEQAIRRDLEICKSSRDQLARQVEDLQVAVRKEREQSGWEMATRLTAVLAKLSALANLEPDQVLGLSERAVFEEFRTELGRAAGGRLEPFPGKHEMADNTLWLDADQNGLEALQARYDWSPERPFEGLLPGSRRLPFRLSRRGWSVGERVLQRAHVVPMTMEQELAADLQPEEPAVEPDRQPDEPDAGQVQG